MRLIPFFCAQLLRYAVVAQAPPDIVINEILFNPSPQGTDYIEIYNRSDKTIPLAGWRIANRNAAGTIGSIKTFPAQTVPLAPGEYRVLTEEPRLVQLTHYVKDTAIFIQIGTMPSYPDASGTVVLLDARNTVTDEVKYNEKWHFALLDKSEGVALERIDFNKTSQDASNWHSAASSAGYGTPGYKNSQYNSYTILEGAIHIEPRLFSPDNDGYNDYAIISYTFPEPGYVCNLTFFNTSGIPVKRLARNALCGITGYFKWDGLDEKHTACPTGPYILLAEVFNLKGKTLKLKQLVTLARKQN